jgi:hypothetical protein
MPRLTFLLRSPTLRSFRRLDFRLPSHCMTADAGSATLAGRDFFILDVSYGFRSIGPYTKYSSTTRSSLKALDAETGSFGAKLVPEAAEAVEREDGGWRA